MLLYCATIYIYHYTKLLCFSLLQYPPPIPLPILPYSYYFFNSFYHWQSLPPLDFDVTSPPLHHHHSTNSFATAIIPKLLFSNPTPFFPPEFLSWCWHWQDQFLHHQSPCSNKNYDQCSKQGSNGKSNKCPIINPIATSSNPFPQSSIITTTSDDKHSDFVSTSNACRETFGIAIGMSNLGAFHRKISLSATNKALLAGCMDVTCTNVVRIPFIVETVIGGGVLSTSQLEYNSGSYPRDDPCVLLMRKEAAAGLGYFCKYIFQQQKLNNGRANNLTKFLNNSSNIQIKEWTSTGMLWLPTTTTNPICPPKTLSILQRPWAVPKNSLGISSGENHCQMQTMALHMTSTTSGCIGVFDAAM